METVSTFVMTPELAQPVIDAINTGLTNFIPVGVGIMATFIGIQIFRRVLYQFL